VNFTIGNTISGGDTINVTLPYASFDLQAEYPFVSNSSRYFPLQRAANDTQYTLGRVFLQEAYLIVDYERLNFSLHPCVWDTDSASHVVSIPGVNTTGSMNTTGTSNGGSTGNNTNDGSSSNNKLSAGAIAGIVIGVLVIVIVIPSFLVCFLVIIPRRKKREAQQSEAQTASDGQPVVPELHGDFNAEEVEGSAGGPKPKELQDSLHTVGIELPTEPPETEGAQIFEMPGSDVPEMAAGYEKQAEREAEKEKDRKRFSWEDP
jgi:hypothetical protein